MSFVRGFAKKQKLGPFPFEAERCQSLQRVLCGWDQEVPQAPEFSDSFKFQGLEAVLGAWRRGSGEQESEQKPPPLTQRSPAHLGPAASRKQRWG